MKFCSNCGETVQHTIPDGDNRLRFVCCRCDTIHYQNPRIIAGCLPLIDIEGEEQVLLCRRAIEPRKGYWTLPAGFMENVETCGAGAMRETFEEALATVTLDGLYSVFSMPHISQVYMFFKARLVNDSFAAGEESLEVALFKEADIPWTELAFPVMTNTLKFYFEDRKSGQFPTHYEDIIIQRKPKS